MGCIASSQRVDVITMSTSEDSWQNASGKETVLAALVRLDQDIEKSEKLYPAQRLAVVTAELESIQQEIKNFEETTNSITNIESYPKTMHQIFVNLDLYRRPILATENEDFVANVNRKEMRKLELNWLRVREKELQSDRRRLHAQLLRIRSLYTQLKQLLSCIWTDDERPGTSLEGACERARALRDALALVSARLRASAESVHTALRLLDDALPVWKLASVGKSGWERTRACSDACRLLVQARCSERDARRVLVATAAPRAARALRLAMDYAFTDTMHDHKFVR
ncbi:unnamed protein product [Euphydryas editha]|uniref:Uncharacterized protein n=1 Tax=Euphydryas editha TaxID=104508 RepID=A0AAU9V5S6_EUPED|nr:unnamed protein product [Euphydryas editha]